MISDGERLDRALDRFALRASSVERLSGGNMTSAWVAREDVRRYVLRRLPAGTESRARTRHHLLRFLSWRVPGVPQPMASREGDTVADVDGETYELLTYVEGDVARSPDELDFEDGARLASMARYLARLHRAVREYEPLADAVWPSPSPATLDWRAVAESLRRDPRSDAAALLGKLDRFAERAGALNGADEPSLPRHVIHRDFAWYNAVHRGRVMVGLIDFDEAAPGARIDDHGWALPLSVPLAPDRPLDCALARVRLFLDSYQEELPLSREELEALPVAIARRLAQAAIRLLDWHARGDARLGALLDHALGYVDWLAWYEADAQGRVAEMLSSLGQAT